MDVLRECMSTTVLEQLAGNRLIYLCAGLGCAVVAIGFAVGELLYMDEK